MPSSHDIWKTYQRWCRLLILLCEGGEFLWKDILPKMGIKDVTDGREIYSKLRFHKRKKKEMGLYHQKSLLPENEVIDTTKTDISLRTHIIQILDQTEEYSQIVKLRRLWIELLHMSEDERIMKEKQFKEYWDDISLLLTKHFNFDMDLVKDLKTESHLTQDFESILQVVTKKIEGTV